MLKAVLNHGEIRPLEPLPDDWPEGQRLSVERADDGDTTVEEIDRDFAVLAALCEATEPTDEERFECALQEARRQAKEQVRRQQPPVRDAAESAAGARANPARNLKRVLEAQFPPPDKVTLRDDDGIIGIVTSQRFRRMDTMQRQDLIHDLLTAGLTPQERRQVVLIVAVTPEEEIANSGADD